MTSLLELDPFSSEFVADPYPYYSRLIEESPVCWVPNQQMWMVTRYADVASVLRNPAVFSSARGMDALFAGTIGRNRTDMRQMLGFDMSELRVLIATDPPHHTRLRRLLSRAFTPNAIAELEPRIREVCDDIVSDLLAKAEAGVADLITDFAIPFPVTIIAELLGIPADRRQEFREWSDAMVGTLSGDWDPSEAQERMSSMFEFMAEVVEHRRGSPADDLVSRLVRGTDPADPDALNVIELTMFAILLLVAGNETTTNLIGNAAAALAAHPEEAELLWSKPELLTDAIEEVLRWDSPVQGLMRATTESATIGGVRVDEESLILVSFAAANRDPSHFPDPGRFDIRRRPADHFAFGHGIHFCLGASLARLEARLAGECLLARGVKLKPEAGAQRTDSFLLRGFTHFPVSCG